MSKSSNRLTWATWILAISTIIFTMSNLWGQDATNKILGAAVVGIMQGFALLIVGAISIGIIILGLKEIIKKSLEGEYLKNER